MKNDLTCAVVKDLLPSYIEKLTSVLTHKLIDKIIIHSPEETDGEKTQKIEIYYKFVGRLD